MNRERLTELAEMLEGTRAMPEGFTFDMGSWLFRSFDPECGTAGCIAGLAWQLYGAAALEDDEASHDVLLNATAQLGLRGPLADELFFGRSAAGKWWSLSDITPAHAARAIRHVLEHGEPRWDEVMGAGPA